MHYFILWYVGIYNKNLDDVNRVYDSEYYTSSMYSSSSSSNYMDFYYNSLGNEIIFRTYRMMPNPNNLFFNIYMGNKYIVSDRYDSSLYEEVEDGVYKSDDVLPIGYAGQKLMSLSYYNTLSYPENIYAYLNYTIVDDDNIDSIYDSVFERIDLDYEIVSSDVEIKETDRGIYIDVLKNSELKLKINNDLDEKILLLSFKMDYNTSCSVGDQTITINGIKNKLSCDSWKYHNNNYVFEYVLSDNDLDELDVVFSKGVFLISEFEFYVIDKDDIEKIDDDISEFVIDREKTKGDVIYGSIDVLDDGYFNLSIPYDEGFSIFVDGEEVTYERVNVNFIGFKISEGKHDIVIKYASPLKSVGIIFSIIGFILLLGGRFMVSLIEFVGGFMNGKLGKFVKDMYFKYKEIFNYLVVGVLTTLVSLGSKWILLFTILDAGDAFELQLAIIISWIIAVFFAYFANRIFVFNSKNKNIFKEMIQFFGARVLTLIMEMVIMWFFVTLLGLDSNIWVMVWTFVTQVLIMIFNYIFSKLFVFKKK